MYSCTMSILSDDLLCADLVSALCSWKMAAKMVTNLNLLLHSRPCISFHRLMLGPPTTASQQYHLRTQWRIRRQQTLVAGQTYWIQIAFDNPYHRLWDYEINSRIPEICVDLAGRVIRCFHRRHVRCFLALQFRSRRLKTLVERCTWAGSRLFARHWQHGFSMMISPPICFSSRWVCSLLVS